MATCPTCQGEFDNATFCPRDGSRLETAPDAGALLGARYRLIRRVGEGAMGVVFEAEHVSIRRRVAVKILRRNLVASPEMVERLRREAEVTSGLGHPNIVECLDFGTEDGQVYLVMEWLDGETLEHRLERESLDVATVLEIAAQICAGLAEAHQRDVIHRDLKPANLFLTRDRAGALRVKILDFGIAKLAAEQTRLTSTGVLVGTPIYMAPEQALGDPIDARADIYALGIILYEMLVGDVPFQGDTPLAVLHQHAAKVAAVPSAAAPGRGISHQLDTLVMKCLAKVPRDRYQTMAELGAALNAARSASTVPPRPAIQPRLPEPPEGSDDELPRPRRGRIVAVLVVIGIIAAGAAVALVVLRQQDKTTPATKDASVFVPSSVVDAASTDANAVADASMLADGAPLDTSSEPVRVVHAHTARFAHETRVSPEHPHHDQPVTLAITLSDLDERGRQALASGRLAVRVTIQHFAKHDVVARETLAVDAEGRAKLVWVPRHGKHHVLIEPLADSTSLGRTKFDVHAD